MMNQVQFETHAVERLVGRYAGYIGYGLVQTVLVNKPVRHGVQKVTITTLDKAVTIKDPTARNGQVHGKTFKAVVEAGRDNTVKVITIVLE